MTIDAKEYSNISGVESYWISPSSFGCYSSSADGAEVVLPDDASPATAEEFDARLAEETAKIAVEFKRISELSERQRAEKASVLQRVGVTEEELALFGAAAKTAKEG